MRGKGSPFNLGAAKIASKTHETSEAHLGREPGDLGPLLSLSLSGCVNLRSFPHGNTKALNSSQMNCGFKKTQETFQVFAQTF
jgi:hypothetical protein